MFNTNITLPTQEILQLSWEHNWSNFKITQNGQPLATTMDKDALKLGQVVLSQSGKPVNFILRGKELEAWCDGMDLVSGAETGSSNHFNRAVYALYSFGGYWIFVTLIVGIASKQWSAMGLAVIALLFIALGWYAKRNITDVPFKIGLGIILLLMVGNLSQGDFTGIVVSAIFAFYLYKGIGSRPYGKFTPRKMDEKAPLDADL